MATKGQIPVVDDGVGNALLSPGLPGTVLTSNGVTALPTYQAVPSVTIPAGLIVLWAGLLSLIPSGWLLCDGTNGTPDLRAMFVKGSAAGINPGVTGGAATHTPTGTVSTPTFTGSSNQTTSATSAGTPAGSVAAPTFTGSSATTSAVSGGTPAGTVAAPMFTGTAFSSIINHTHPVTSTLSVQGGTAAAVTGTHVMASTATGGSVRAVTAGDVIASASQNPAGGVASITPAGTNTAPVFTGSALGTHTHTLTATGTNSAPTFTGDALGTHTHTLTPAGTVSQPVFTGQSANTEPAYYSVAFLMKAA